MMKHRFIAGLELLSQSLRYFIYRLNQFVSANRDILSGTSKPPLNIFSNISAHIKHTQLKFTLNMDKSILEGV